MSKMTVEQGLALGGLLLLAKECGEDLEKGLIEYLEETHPTATREIAASMFSVISSVLLGDMGNIPDTPLEDTADAIINGFKPKDLD